MNNTALYIGADPLVNNDVDLIRKSIRTFGFIHIFLDRKNRDSEYKEYFLSYDDRCDIIHHELKALKIDSYIIIPVDETLQKSIHDNNITTLVLNFDYQRTTKFRMMTLFQEVNPDLNIMLMSADNFIERHFMKTLMDSDSTMKLYKKYCSDYTFYKFKVKQTKKVCILTKPGYNIDFVEDILEDHGFSVLDIDKQTVKPKTINEMMALIGRTIISNFSNTIIVKISNKFKDDTLCKIFDDVVYIGDKCENTEYADEIIVGTKQEIINRTIHMINRKTKSIKKM